VLDFEDFQLFSWPVGPAVSELLLLSVVMCLQVYRRMMRCCSELGCHTQVSVLH